MMAWKRGSDLKASNSKDTASMVIRKARSPTLLQPRVRLFVVAEPRVVSGDDKRRRFVGPSLNQFLGRGLHVHFPTRLVIRLVHLRQRVGRHETHRGRAGVFAHGLIV